MTESEERTLQCGMCREFPCELLAQYINGDAQGEDGTYTVRCGFRREESDPDCGWLDSFLRSFPCVTRDYKAEWQWIRYQVGGKMFAAICKDAAGTRNIITIKLEASDGDFLRQQYEDIVPGHYMNKVHWNSIYLDGKVPAELMKDLIDRSYHLVLGGLPKKKQREIMIKTDFGSTDSKLEWHTMTDAEKQSACLWRYEGEYVMYNLPSYEEMKAKRRGFMRPEAEKNYYSFYDGDRFVGYVNLAEKESEVSIGIGVGPEFCNRGYGQRIMSEACRIAERLYPSKPLCLQVRVWNKRAINCYLKSGFVIDGEAYFLETHAGSGLFYKMRKKSE